MKGHNLNSSSSLPVENQAEAEARQSLSGKKAINVKLETLKKIEEGQRKQHEMTADYLKKQEQLLKQREAEVRHQALELLQNQQRDTRVRLEQAVDFALRSMPWWSKLSFGAVIKKAANIMEMMDSQTLIINIREMNRAMARDQEQQALAAETQEAGPGLEPDAPVDTMEAIEREEAAAAAEKAEE